MTKRDHIIHIPTREEFHREFAGEIRIEDFCTDKPSRFKVPYTLAERSCFRSVKVTNNEDNY